MSTNGTNGANGNGNKHPALNYWANDPRWSGITRPYSYSDVVRLRGSIQIEYTLARLGAERLWNLMYTDAYVPALGAITGNQAIEMVQAGLKAIYGSGWQVAADGNTAGDVYPDQSPHRATPHRILWSASTPHCSAGVRSNPPKGRPGGTIGLRPSGRIPHPAPAALLKHFSRRT